MTILFLSFLAQMVYDFVNNRDGLVMLKDRRVLAATADVSGLAMTKAEVCVTNYHPFLYPPPFAIENRSSDTRRVRYSWIFHFLLQVSKCLRAYGPDE